MNTSVIQSLTTESECAELNSIFARAFGEPRSYSSEHVNTLLSREDVYLLGAYIEGKLVGGLCAYELPLLRGVTEIYLYDIAVDVPYQGKGIGTKLIAELKQCAAVRGVETIFVEAEADDEPAVRFYRSLGEEEIEVLHYNITVR